MDSHKAFVIKLFSAVLLSLGFLIAPLAYADTSLSVQSVFPGAEMNQGSTVSFNVVASGFTSPTYALTDSFAGSTISNADISTSGGFSWMPTVSDVGSHTITITATDSLGDSATTQQPITVDPAPTVSIQSLSPGSSVIGGATVSFSVVPSGFTNPLFTVSDSLTGSSVSSSNINGSGVFSWTTDSNQIGLHTLTVTVTDALGHSASVSQAITVNSVGTLSIQSLSPSSSVNVGQALSFVASAPGLTNPVFSLSDSSYGSTVSNADISSSGSFLWTPTTSDIGAHAIEVLATDALGHSINASVLINVSAAPTPTPTTTTPTPSTIGTLEAELAQLETQITAAGGTAPSSATNSGFVFSTYLSPGITSNDVTQLQTVLTQQGMFSGPVSGYYGPLTTSAVERFQTAHGLSALGVVGPATRAALNALSSGTTATASTSTATGYVFSNFLDMGSTGQDVTELQTRLTGLGDYSGPITGYFGALTQVAVEQFQGAHGITPVGYVGPSTRAALNQ